MISYPVYKIIHYVGIFLLMTALVAVVARTGFAFARGSSDTDGQPDPWRKRLVATHGVALFLILLGGFGMLARLDVTHQVGGLPGWIWAKLVLWVALGAGTLVVKRRPELSGLMLVVVPVLAMAAAATALFKPF